MDRSMIYIFTQKELDERSSEIIIHSGVNKPVLNTEVMGVLGKIGKHLYLFNIVLYLSGLRYLMLR